MSDVLPSKVTETHEMRIQVTIQKINIISNKFQCCCCRKTNTLVESAFFFIDVLSQTHLLDFCANNIPNSSSVKSPPGFSHIDFTISLLSSIDDDNGNDDE